MKTISIPNSVGDLLSDPQRVADAFALLNALATLQVHLVPPTNAQALAPGNQAIRGDPPNLILPLPLKFTRAISNPSGGATIDAECRATLALLLAELRKNRQLPT